MRIREGRTCSILLSLLFFGTVGTASIAMAQNAGMFTATGTMATARFWHTATLLNDGKVLIAGGEEIFGGVQRGISTAELYDPAAGVFAAAGTMTIARAFHTATLLADGSIPIAGGRYNQQLLSSAELYDPATGTFSETGAMTAARDSHTATLLPSGKVLITGGWVRASPSGLATAELYDPSTGEFADIDPMTVSWFGSTATSLPNGNVLIASAYDGRFFPNAEVYDSVSNTFALKGVAVSGYYWHTATLLLDGTVLIAGGGDADIGTSLAARAHDHLQ